ncbi:hypothetical protein PGT21_021791 [Puccinia graminis f. sp. tritici]|uniref:Transcription factor 25 n=2 Tax=Puccinia graminis f. sp. tritici TaxID=56615 RepID=E3K4W0_PUCGT|nr:uncharacterized protein PGTG_05596 [Puccinia graminis f. sp. tritici CRL 75-36-700-3]EFP79275.2 hypothetical protein PGTG_05596 [Puccinia graminis f. sp. tritici CRL 75-36-700-3]KAA1087093.1 hypothetical protein PGT21_021791 [Puccinia graminis f. sp. tritici]
MFQAELRRKIRLQTHSKPLKNQPKQKNIIKMGRNSKRQQREDQELQLLTTAATTTTPTLDSEEEHEETGTTTKSGRQNLFNSFNIESTNLEEEKEEEEEEEKLIDPASISRGTTKKNKPKKKKKKNKTTTALDTPTETPPTTKNAQNNNQTDKLSSSRGPNGKQKESETDEIDEALQILGKQLKATNFKSPQSELDQQESCSRINNLLKVDPKMLDPELELRRMFGAKVVSSSGSTLRPFQGMYGPRITNDPHHQLNTKLKMKGGNMLAKPEPSWPAYNRATAGLSMRRLSDEEVDAGQLAQADLWFRFEHAVSFKLVQSRFLQAIMSLDPNQLVAILPRAPYHPDTLLQLSEVAAHNEDQGQATRFLNQALFVNEKTLWTAASSFFSAGHCRLDFKIVENRNLFKALDLKFKLLLKQGCYRSSFQTCKFLFSLNPYQDPFGSLLWLDFLAPKANQDEFFIELLDNLAALQNRDPNGGIYTEAYPGLYYARALCLRAIEEKDRASNHDPSDFALESAILRFPQVIKPLARAIGLSIPTQYERIERAQVEEGYTDDVARNMLHLKARIYAVRSASLWKVAEISEWLRQILERAVVKFSQPDDPDVQLGTQFATNPQLHSAAAEGIYRAVLVSDVQAFKNFLPPAVYSHSTTAFSFDPLPPEGGTSYDAEYFRKGDEMIDGPSEMARRREAEEEEEEEEGFAGGMVGEEEAERALEELFENGDVDHLEPEQLNQVANQLQLFLQLGYERLQPEQREVLRARFDRLFERRQHVPPPVERPADEDHHSSTSDDDVDLPMPGAFANTF